MEYTDATESFDTVVEMTSDPALLVPIDTDTVARVTAGDDDPLFATFVIESGWSKSRRLWGPELFAKVAEQINSTGEAIVGYQGHISESDDPYLFPDIQLQWLGAKLIQSGEKAKLAVKAYALPGTKGREYLKRGLVKTVSWRGKVAQERYEKGVRVKDFLIESIDLSRPRAAGMNARLTALTSEMEMEGEISVKPEEIAALTANELRAHNPALVATLESEAKAPLETRVSEMTAAVADLQPTQDFITQLRSLFALGDDVDDTTVLGRAVSEIRKAGKTLRDSLIGDAVSKKLKGDSADVALARRVIVGEMSSKSIDLTGDEDKDTKTVTEMVNEIIDGSDELKKIVSEMEETPPNLQNTGNNNRGGDRELKPGFESTTLRVKALS